MKFKGQGKINICGFEYKKNIADSRRGGFRAPKKKTCIRACTPPPDSVGSWRDSTEARVGGIILREKILFRLLSHVEGLRARGGGGGGGGGGGVDTS